jgi:hypothetical protein
MKLFTAVLLIILWMVATVALAITLIGLVVVLNDEWFEVPKKLLAVFEPEKKS